jgi:hypothetical protein
MQTCAFPAWVVDVVASACPCLRQFPENIQRRYAFFCWIDGKYQHNAYDGYSSIHYSILDELFGQSKFISINNAVGAFEVKPHAPRKHTRGFRLLDHVRAAIQEKKKVTPFACEMIRLVDKQQPKKRTWGGKPKKLDHTIFQKPVKIDMENLSFVRTLWLEEIERTDDEEYRKHLEYREDYAYALLCLAAENNGYINDTFHVVDTGRIFACGISIQSAPREVRAAALPGLHDFDISACHPTIFVHVAKEAGHEAKHVQHFIGNKRVTREGIASRTNVSTSVVKDAMNAVIYGASIYKKNGKLAKEIGEDVAARLFADHEFAAYAKDVYQGFKAILASRKYRGGFDNAAGIYVHAGSEPQKKMAAIMQGIEVRALFAASRVADIETPIHDGFICRQEIDVALVEAAMFEDTGIKFRLEHKVLQSPAIERTKEASEPSVTLKEAVAMGASLTILGAILRLPLSNKHEALAINPRIPISRIVASVASMYDG